MKYLLVATILLLTVGCATTRTTVNIQYQLPSTQYGQGQVVINLIDR